MSKNRELITEHKEKWFDFINYVPHNGQKKLHFPSKDWRFCVAVCGRRWGKSVSASVEAQVVLSQSNKRVWCVAPTYDGSEKIFREIWHKMVVEKSMPTTRASYKDQYIEFEWGSVVEGKSADKPDSLVGEGLDLLILDEAAKIKKKTWEMYLRPTLSDRKGSALFITTPQGFNWVYDLYLLGQKDEMWHSFNSPSHENNYAYPDGNRDSDLLEAKRNLAKEVYDQEYGAKFTSFAGRVYPFDRNLDMGHFPYDPGLPTFCSIDFGFRQPAALWFQTYREEGLWHIRIIDEIIHETDIKTDDFANRIKSRNYKYVTYYGDPAGGQAQGQTGLGDIEIFKRHGIVVKTIRDKVSRKIEAGVSHVRGFIENAEGKRFLHVHNECHGIAEDLENYRYPEPKEGFPLKPDPVKDGYHDHGCDALRYFFINRFPIKNREVRIIQR